MQFNNVDSDGMKLNLEKGTLGIEMENRKIGNSFSVHIVKHIL